MFRSSFRSMAGSILGAAMLLGSGAASAMPILTATEAPNSPLAGPGTYTTAYTVTNPGGSGTVVTDVEVLFDANLYDDIQVVDLPSLDWIVEIAQPFPSPFGFDDQGSAYFFTDPGTAVLPDTSLSGFVLQYTYLGTDAMPLSGQSYSFFDITNFNFDPVGEGTFSSAEVPEPASLALFAIGAAGFVATRRRRTALIKGA